MRLHGSTSGSPVARCNRIENAPMLRRRFVKPIRPHEQLFHFLEHRLAPIVPKRTGEESECGVSTGLSDLEMEGPVPIAGFGRLHRFRAGLLPDRSLDALERCGVAA